MKKGEVWLVNFSPQVGDEIKKIRPAIMVNNDAMGLLNLKIVVPITSSFHKVHEWQVLLKSSNRNGLEKDSIADCFQLKSISKNRFISKIGDLNEQELNRIKVCMMKVLDLL
jgi:mRNA interferase MazF